MNSSVQSSSRRILFEVASFHAGGVRKTSRRLSASTESAKRFARGGLDPALVELSRRRIVQLLQEAGALEKYEGIVVAGSPAVSRSGAVPLRWERAEKILGFPLARSALEKQFAALGFREEKGAWIPPQWRMDVVEEIDLWEEIARLSDQEKIPAILDSQAEGRSVEDGAQRMARQIRAFLVERGYFEVLSGALVKADEGKATRLSLAAGPDAASYRQSLLPGLGRAAARNISRGGIDLKLFELGRASAAAGQEELRLALLVSGRERPVHWQEGESGVDLFSLQGVWEELQKRFSGVGRPLVLRAMSSEEKKAVGMKSSVWVAEGAMMKSDPKTAVFQAVSSYPGVQRDLALVMPDRVSFAEVEKAIREVAPTEMEGCQVFDRFRDPQGIKVPVGFLSLGCRLQFRSTARTLSDEEVSGWEKQILQSLSSRCEAKLRSVL